MSLFRWTWLALLTSAGCLVPPESSCKTRAFACAAQYHCDESIDRCVPDGSPGSSSGSGSTGGATSTSTGSTSGTSGGGQTCLIDGKTWQAGDFYSPSFGCSSCQPALDSQAWTPLPDRAALGDGGVCKGGAWADCASASFEPPHPVPGLVPRCDGGVCALPPRRPRLAIYTFGVEDVVVDQLTGLIWERSLHPLSPQAEAEQKCISIGWRLPTAFESSTLADFTATVAVDPILFPPGDNQLWTSSHRSSNPAMANSFDAKFGTLQSDFTTVNHQYRCVRGNTCPLPGPHFKNNSATQIYDFATGLSWEASTRVGSFPVADGGCPPPYRFPTVLALESLLVDGCPGLDPAFIIEDAGYPTLGVTGASNDPWSVGFSQDCGLAHPISSTPSPAYNYRCVQGP